MLYGVQEEFFQRLLFLRKKLNMIYLHRDLLILARSQTLNRIPETLEVVVVDIDRLAIVLEGEKFEHLLATKGWASLETNVALEPTRLGHDIGEAEVDENEGLEKWTVANIRWFDVVVYDF